MADEGRPVHPWGAGMPTLLHLHEFGRVVHLAFGRYPELVGSALTTKTPRDLDVRLSLPQSEYMALVGPVAEFGKPGTRWAALALAFSALGREMTGKVVDFQVQYPGISNQYRDEQRYSLGYGVGRFTTAEREQVLDSVISSQRLAGVAVSRYADLTEEQKENDRQEVRRYLHLVREAE